MNRIMVATDFSERSDRAIRRAILLAKSNNATLSLIHVIDNDQPNRLVEAEREMASRLLEELRSSISEIDQINCEASVVLGEAFEGIVEAAEENGADLVVIGPHRRKMIKDVFVGTTAERTIRTSRVPVLMANGVPTEMYRQVLVALDFSAGSMAAIRSLSALGLDKKPEVSVVHVFDTPAAPHLRRAALTNEEMKGYMEEVEGSAKSELSVFLDQAGFVPAREVLRPVEHSISHDVCTIAAELSADLLVLGTHGRAGMKRLLIGSIAEAILREAKMDVLAIPASG